MLGHLGALAILAAVLCQVVRPVAGLALPIGGSLNISQSLDQRLTVDHPPEFIFIIRREGLLLDERKFLLTATDVINSLAANLDFNQKVFKVAGHWASRQNIDLPGVILILKDFDHKLEARHAIWGIWEALCDNGFRVTSRQFMETTVSLGWKEQSGKVVSVGLIEIRRAELANIGGLSNSTPIDTSMTKSHGELQRLPTIHKQSSDHTTEDIHTSHPQVSADTLEFDTVGNKLMDATQLALPICKMVILIAQMDKGGSFGSHLLAIIPELQSSFMFGSPPGVDPGILPVMEAGRILGILRDKFLLNKVPLWQYNIRYIEANITIAIAQTRIIG